MSKNIQSKINHLTNVLTHDLPKVDKSFSSLRKIGISVRFFNDIRINSFLGWSKISHQPYIGVNNINTFPKRKYLVLKEIAYLFLVEKWSPFSNNRKDKSTTILHSNLTQYNTKPKKKHHKLYRLVFRKKLRQQKTQKEINDLIIEHSVARILTTKDAIDEAKKFATSKQKFYQRLANFTGLSSSEAKAQYQRLVKAKQAKSKAHKSVYGAKKVG